MSCVRIRSITSSISCVLRSDAIEVEFADDLFEARAAQDLLIERGQAILEPHPHGRLHVALGNLLRHDEDERLGAKPVWQPPGH